MGRHGNNKSKSRAASKSAAIRSQQLASMSRKKNREGTPVSAVDDGIPLVKADPENAQIAYDPEKDKVTIGKGRNAISIQPSGERVEKSVAEASDLVETLKSVKVIDGFFNNGEEVRALHRESLAVEADVKDGLLRPKVDDRGRPTTFPTEEVLVRTRKRAHVHTLNFVQQFAETGLLCESTPEGYHPEAVLMASVVRIDREEMVSDVKPVLRYIDTGAEVDRSRYWFVLRMNNIPVAATPSEAYYEFANLMKARISKRTGVYLGREKTDEDLAAEAKRKAKAKKERERALAKAKEEDPPTAEEEAILEDEKRPRPSLATVDKEGATTFAAFPRMILQDSGTNAVWLEVYWYENLDRARPVFVDLSWYEYYAYGSLRDRLVKSRLQWYYLEFSRDHLSENGEWEAKNYVIETRANSARAAPGTWAALRHHIKLAERERKEQERLEIEKRKKERRVKFDEALAKEEEEEEEEESPVDPDLDPAFRRQGTSTCDAEAQLRRLASQSKARDRN